MGCRKQESERGKMVSKRRNGNPHLSIQGLEEERCAYLEEIEAPMWVDLTLEAQNKVNDIDDAWFQTCHLFHQCSSYDLISFSLSRKGKIKSPYLQKTCPNLPSTISKSRGKHYKSTRWRTPEHIVNSGDKRPLRIMDAKKSSLFSDLTTSTLTSVSLRNDSLCSGDQTIFMDSNESRTSECQSSSTGGPEAIRHAFNQESIGSTGSSNHRVDIEAVDIVQPVFSGTSHPTFKSGFLEAVRIGLAKNKVAGHASRVKFEDGTLSKGQKPSLSKPNRGSSCNPGYDIKNNHKNKEITNNVQNTSNRRKSSSPSRVASDVSQRTFSGQQLEINSNLKRNLGMGGDASKCDCRYSNSKTRLSNATRKPLRLLKPLQVVNTKSENNVRSSKLSTLTNDGKENNVQGKSQNKKASTNSAVKDGNGFNVIKVRDKENLRARNSLNMAKRVQGFR